MKAQLANSLQTRSVLVDHTLSRVQGLLFAKLKFPSHRQDSKTVAFGTMVSNLQNEEEEIGLKVASFLRNLYKFSPLSDLTSQGCRSHLFPVSPSDT